MERKKRWGEEEITHKLRFDGETGGVREAKRVGSAAWAEKGDTAVDAEDVEKGLKPAETAENTGSEEENFKEFIFRYGFSLREFNNADGGNEDTPENARSEDGAEKISAPERRKGQIEREEKNEEGKDGFQRVFGFKLSEYIIYIIYSVFQGKNREEKKPDEAQRQFVISAGGFGEVKEWIIRAKKCGGERVEEGEAESS